MTRVNTYDIGEAVVCDATFRDEDGALDDPTEVRFLYETPDDTEIEETFPGDADIVNVSTGLYERVVVPTMHGTHSYRFEGDGADGPVVIERVFYVRRSAFHP